MLKFASILFVFLNLPSPNLTANVDVVKTIDYFHIGFADEVKEFNKETNEKIIHELGSHFVQAVQKIIKLPEAVLVIKEKVSIFLKDKKNETFEPIAILLNKLKVAESEIQALKQEVKISEEIEEKVSKKLVAAKRLKEVTLKEESGKDEKNDEGSTNDVAKAETEKMSLGKRIYFINKLIKICEDANRSLNSINMELQVGISLNDFSELNNKLEKEKEDLKKYFNDFAKKNMEKAFRQISVLKKENKMLMANQYFKSKQQVYMRKRDLQLFNNAGIEMYKSIRSLFWDENAKNRENNDLAVIKWLADIIMVKREQKQIFEHYGAKNIKLTDVDVHLDADEKEITENVDKILSIFTELKKIHNFENAIEQIKEKMPEEQGKQKINDLVLEGIVPENVGLFFSKKYLEQQQEQKNKNGSTSENVKKDDEQMKTMEIVTKQKQKEERKTAVLDIHSKTNEN